MSRVEKWIAGIVAAIVAAGVPAGIGAYVSLASAQSSHAVQIQTLDTEQHYQRRVIEDTAHNMARVCERLGIADCRSR